MTNNDAISLAVKFFDDLNLIQITLLLIACILVFTPQYFAKKIYLTRVGLTYDENIEDRMKYFICPKQYNFYEKSIVIVPLILAFLILVVTVNAELCSRSTMNVINELGAI